MQNNRVCFLAAFFLLFIFALPFVLPAPAFAQDEYQLDPLPGEEELDLEEFGLPSDEDDDEPIPTLPFEDSGRDSTSAPPPPPSVPLAPFEPAPELEPDEEPDEETDAEIEALLLDLAKEEELEQTGLPVEDADKKAVKIIEGTPRRKWWEEENPYKKQMLPEIIYKKEYSKRNEHLPKAYDISDLERWLFKTSADGDVNGMRAILNKNVDPDPRNVYGNTPLILAALHCRADTLRLLLARDANPNVQNKLGLTALHVASYKGCTDIVKALLHMGANPNLKNAQGFTPIEFAATNKHYAVAQLLLNNGAERTSRFFSGMLHEKSILDAVKHGKLERGKKRLPEALPEEQTSVDAEESVPDEAVDAEILEEALGIKPDGTVISEEAGTIEMQESGEIKTADTKEADTGSEEPEDSGWRQTKGGRWIKIGGEEPPQGVAGIYWHKIDNVWYPLDVNNPDEARKIEELKTRLGHTSEGSTVEELSAQPLPWQGAVKKTKPESTTVKPAIPAEVIEDMKPTPGGNGEPTQGVGGVWWHEVDGEWQPLDPEVAEEAAEIEKLKAIYGTPLEHDPEQEEELMLMEELKSESEKMLESEPMPEITIDEAIMPEQDNSDIPIEPAAKPEEDKKKKKSEPLPDFDGESPIGLLPGEEEEINLEALELPDGDFEELPDFPMETEDTPKSVIIIEEDEEEEEFPPLPELPVIE